MRRLIMALASVVALSNGCKKSSAGPATAAAPQVVIDPQVKQFAAAIPAQLSLPWNEAAKVAVCNAIDNYAVEHKYKFTGYDPNNTNYRGEPLTFVFKTQTPYKAKDWEWDLQPIDPLGANIPSGVVKFDLFCSCQTGANPDMIRMSAIHEGDTVKVTGVFLSANIEPGREDEITLTIDDCKFSKQ